MSNYSQAHAFYAGADLHARTIFLPIVLRHRIVGTERFLRRDLHSLARLRERVGVRVAAQASADARA